MAPEPSGQGDRASDRSEDRAGAKRPRRRLWRSRILPLVAVALIGFAIWYLQASPMLPLLGKPAGSRDARNTGGATQTAAFGSLPSEGVKLGAAGGPGPKVGEPAPDFSLLDPQGKVVRLSDLRGQTIVVNFWATWCIPCRQEFPEFVTLSQQNTDRGLVILGVDLQESAGAVRSFAAEFDATYPLVIDSKGDVSHQYRILGLPATFFIDSQGVLRAQHVGQITAASLATELAKTGFRVGGSP
ncbi:MAG: TlpA family protein disulfide reductase [Dehalococcoidia bacterium]